MAQPLLKLAKTNGTTLAYAEWNPDLKGQAPTLLLTHATGFHGRVWDSLIARLPRMHVISVDLRGHGRSETSVIESWQQVTDDVTGLIDVLALPAWIGVGHSMGGHVLLRSTAMKRGTAQKLILIDPMIASPGRYADANSWFPSDEMHPAARRKRTFSSVDEMIDRFRNREPYRSFDADVMRDYCVHGLAPRHDGAEGLELACAPETEASVYMTSHQSGGIMDLLNRAELPVLVVRAPILEQRSFKSSPTWPGLAGALPQGRDLFLPDYSHFVPFEAPALIAATIEAECAQS